MTFEIGSIQPNPYLFKIESRRNQRGRLAHEIGAGAKCTKCKEKCSGFQLHYWRKLCLNCRCSKEQHEIDEDEDDIGRIVIGKLFDRPIRTVEEEEEYSYGTNLELVNNNTGKKEEYVFDWIPPGVAKDLVTRYMQLLPQEKWPVTGSMAARNRRKQLEQQLPLYDMDENERCENMLPEEMKNFQKHLNTVRSKVVGQASVIEVNVILEKPNIPMANNTSLATVSLSLNDNTEQENNSNNNFSPIRNTNVHQATSRINYPKGIQELDELFNSLDISPESNRASNTNWSQKEDNLQQLVEGSIRNLKSPHSDVQHSQKLTSHLTASRALPLQRSQNLSSYQPDSEPIYANLSQLRGDSNPTAFTSGSSLTHLQSSTLPNLPEKGSALNYTNAMQAPYSPHKDILRGPEVILTSENANILLAQEDSCLTRQNQTNRVQSTFKCQHCHEVMAPGDVAVICEKASPDMFWHPNCFVCATCDELLADLIYFYKEGKVYCGRHYHVVSNIPRCHACDELIFSDTWTRADGFDWHIHHYSCFICDNPLAGNKYIPDSRGYPHCISCYMSFMAKMCETCELRITPDQTRAGYNGYYYHALPQCFCCHHCQASLLSKKFKMSKNWVFCSQNCIVACANEIDQNPNENQKSEL